MDPTAQVLASQPSPEKLLAMITAPGYSVPDQWQVQIQAQLQIKANVLVKTAGLTPDAVRAAHFEPIDDVAAAVARLAEGRRSGCDAVRTSARSADDSVPAMRTGFQTNGLMADGYG